MSSSPRSSGGPGRRQPPGSRRTAARVTAPPVCYRRSPHLVFYWNGGRLVVSNYATGGQVFARPIVCEILDFFDGWRTAEELTTLRPGLREAELPQLLALLAERSLLHRSDDPATPSEYAMDGWTDWNPAAGFFHGATRNLEYGDLRTIDRLSREKARTVPMPDSLKAYPGAAVQALPRVPAEGELARTLLRRRTWRRFAKRPVGVAAFSALLALTAGVQAWLQDRHGGRVALKTSPSGGARHALELYTVVLNVEGLARGLYHYACDRHALHLIDRSVPARAVERYLPTQYWFNGASALVFFAAVYSRVQWRYTHARAYRAPLIEAGHLCQTFCLTATSLGLAPFSSMALADSRIEEDFGLDGIREAVLYAAGVGMPPADVRWNPPAILGTSRQRLTARQEAGFPGRIARRRSAGK